MHAPAPSGIYVPPDTFTTTDNRLTVREWWDGYWTAIESALCSGSAVGESLGAHAVTSDATSIDIAFEVAMNSPEDFEKMLRLAALAGQAYRQLHGEPE